MFLAHNLIKINRAEEQRARRVQAFLLYRKQSSQRLARFAPHCMNEEDLANYQSNAFSICMNQCAANYAL